ncbi:MAG TPA: hypothetical protein V6C81_16840 [Planktothrix sp.]
MRASTTAPPTASKRKRSNNETASVLATCPVNGAGWCPYPFSPAQLEKRLKNKMLEQKNAEKSAKN